MNVVQLFYCTDSKELKKEFHSVLTVESLIFPMLVTKNNNEPFIKNYFYMMEDNEFNFIQVWHDSSVISLTTIMETSLNSKRFELLEKRFVRWCEKNKNNHQLLSKFTSYLMFNNN